MITTYYQTLNDAAVLHDGLAAGTTEVWYISNHNWFRDRELVSADVEVTEADIMKNYVLLGTIRETDPERIFQLLQGENWSPNGEASGLLMAKGLHHTSMMVGDAVRVNGVWSVVQNCGFSGIKVLS